MSTPEKLVRVSCYGKRESRRAVFYYPGDLNENHHSELTTLPKRLTHTQELSKEGLSDTYATPRRIGCDIYKGEVACHAKFLSVSNINRKTR